MYPEARVKKQHPNPDNPAAPRRLTLARKQINPLIFFQVFHDFWLGKPIITITT